MFHRFAMLVISYVVTKYRLYRKSDEKRELPLDEKHIPDAAFRSPWRRDYARVVHCASFRRLQGKTQLFYGNEAVVRNRLTHSLEVAQIAKAIAFKVRAETGLEVNPDIVEIAGLVHDMGHPPFGHNGEKALNKLMCKHGGFEGNAQSLRILTKLEKKQKASGTDVDGFDSHIRDQRFGLNLTYRVIASALKYDSEIPLTADAETGLNKGYYQSEAHIIEKVKRGVLGRKYDGFEGKFKTIECAIMDLADDIAYSTYDLEDAFKAGFINPLGLLAASDDERGKIRRIRERVNKNIETNLTDIDIIITLAFLVADEFREPTQERIARLKENDPIRLENPYEWILHAAVLFQDANALASNGYRRTGFTSRLIEDFISGVKVSINTEHPSLSEVYFDPRTQQKVEVLKQFSYFSIIESPRLKIPEHRGYEIVSSIFENIVAKNGQYLLPDDFQRIYQKVDEQNKYRLVCDFIAGMTDHYALRLYNRLHSDVPATIFGPT